LPGGERREGREAISYEFRGLFIFYFGSGRGYPYLFIFSFLCVVPVQLDGLLIEEEKIDEGPSFLSWR
jgi:hypothetical protein